MFGRAEKFWTLPRGQMLPLDSGVQHEENRLENLLASRRGLPVLFASTFRCGSIHSHCSSVRNMRSTKHVVFQKSPDQSFRTASSQQTVQKSVASHLYAPAVERCALTRSRFLRVLSPIVTLFFLTVFELNQLMRVK